MAWSKTCKIVTFIGISVTALIVLIVVLHVSKLCDSGQVYFKGTNKCYTKGLQGPCSSTLVLLQEPNTQYGKCSCDIENNDRALLYHEETNHCYFVFSQAYCEEGQWLNVTKVDDEKEKISKYVPTCEPNRCLDQFPDAPLADVVPLKGGKCGILGQTAEGCENNAVVKFHFHYVLPSCKTPPARATPAPNLGAVGVGASRCPLGSFPSIMGKCQPDFDFDFK